MDEKPSLCQEAGSNRPIRRIDIASMATSSAVFVILELVIIHLGFGIIFDDEGM